ncbi:pre-peptidase C-terminal domain-containing protein [Laspinema sp. A4]|uniref:pre-peptidase C-terminal domain-containing protein n=1 Tax=Laspinema sp. D2d TaxID=2953686 RepID=UPI0021BA4379|nr:pre-peptidase C-terminal domain-containing protein [Laspinema sp. D2d]MCT7986603.1 pre-peptidase C-terminal domain-containing protein [Laspinema sp. D2d]
MLESSELFDPKSALRQNSEPFTGIASGPFSEDFPGAIAALGVHPSQPNGLQNPESIPQGLSPRESALWEDFARFFPEFSRPSHQPRDPLETLGLQMLQVRMVQSPNLTDADSRIDEEQVLSVTRDHLTDWNGGDSHATPSLTGTPENPLPTSGPLNPESGPGDTIATALPIAIAGLESGDRALQFEPNQTVVGQVSTNHPEDFYRFSLEHPGIFTAELTNLTGDADLRLVRDFNGNSIIDPVADRNGNGMIDPEEIEIIAWQPHRGTSDESIRQFLDPGTYTLQAIAFNHNTTNYSLTTQFTPSPTDPQAFALQLNFGPGTEILTDAHRQTIRKAADRIEQMVTQSPFNVPHTLIVDIESGDFGPGFLASAGPTRVRRLDTAPIPVHGEVVFNTNPESDLLDHPRYLYDTMVHELTHVVGFGTLWEDYQAIADYNQGLYDANTFAGQVYGEMLGTFIPTPVELTVNVGEGSDLGHWRKNPTFDNEIGVEAGHPNEQQVTSALTLASLRDLGWTVNYGAVEEYILPQFRSPFA